MNETGQNTEREVDRCQIKVLTSDELIELIYQGEGVPQDKRFVPTEKGGVFEHLDLGDITMAKKGEIFFVAAEIDGEIVGLSQLEKNPRKEDNWWIEFVNVDSKYQGKGYASKMLEKIFDLANKNGKSLYLSAYTIEGKQKLKKTVERLIEKTPIQIFDKNGQVTKTNGL